MEDVARRLDRLERENRRLKVMGLLLIAIVSSVFLMGQVRPAQRIEAESFAVKDRRGVVVAALGVGYEPGSDVGLPWLAFYNDDGTTDTYLQAWQGSPVLQLSAQGVAFIRLTAEPNGDARVRVSGSGGSLPTQVNLRALPGGDTASVFTTAGDAVTSTMQYTRGGSSGTLLLLDSGQHVVWSAP